MKKLRLYSKIKTINGDYEEYSLNNEKQEGKYFEVKYRFWPNLCKMNNKLILRQIKENDNWESEIFIGINNPFEATGIFLYENKGNHADAWGIHRIQINIKKRITFVEANSKVLDTKDKYLLKRK